MSDCVENHAVEIQPGRRDAEREALIRVAKAAKRWRYLNIKRSTKGEIMRVDLDIAEALDALPEGLLDDSRDTKRDK